MGNRNIPQLGKVDRSSESHLGAEKYVYIFIYNVQKYHPCSSNSAMFSFTLFGWKIVQLHMASYSLFRECYLVVRMEK